MAAFRRNQPEALILLTRVPDPQNYGVAELDADGGVTRLVEKPAEPASDLALVGVYMFTPRIHEAARAIQPSGRGELEITDAIQWLVDSEHPVESHVVRGWWKDTGRLDDMLEANRLILETLDRRVEGELTDSQIEGRVVVEPGAVLERSTVRGPAVIGAGARLVDAYIGPYTAIGRHCTIESAEIEHSILLEGSSVKGLDGRMESSLLGRDVVIARGAAPAARLPLHGRRQLRDRDSLTAGQVGTRPRPIQTSLTRVRAALSSKNVKRRSPAWRVLSTNPRLSPPKPFRPQVSRRTSRRP